MAPPKKLDEDQIEELRQRYIAGADQTSLATAYGESVPTVRRYCKGAKQEHHRLLQQVALTSLQAARSQKFRSAGEAANTGIAALKSLRELYPLTMEEAARWVVKLPGFHPEKFAQILIQEWDSTQPP